MKRNNTGMDNDLVEDTICLETAYFYPATKYSSYFYQRIDIVNKESHILAVHLRKENGITM